MEQAKQRKLFSSLAHLSVYFGILSIPFLLIIKNVFNDDSVIQRNTKEAINLDIYNNFLDIYIDSIYSTNYCY